MKNRIRRHNTIIIAALGAAMFFAGCMHEDTGAYDRAVRALEAEDYDTALDEFGKAASEDDRKAEGYRGQGLVYLERGDYSYAVRLFDMSLEAMKHENAEFSEDVLFYKARALEKMPDHAGAKEVYEQLADGSRGQEANALLGSLCLKDGEEQEAEEAFSQACGEDPGYDVYLIIYEAYEEANREGDGAEYLEKALELQPESPADYMKQGQIYAYLEDYQSARESLGTAIDRGNTDAVPLMGYICLMENDTSSARAVYEKVLEEGGRQALAYNGLAMTALADGQYEEALSYIREGLKCNDEEMNESLLFNQIVIYEKALDFDMAREKTEEFLKEYPANTEMKDEYRFLKRSFVVLPEG